jgi:hypothetical protein
LGADHDSIRHTPNLTRKTPAQGPGFRAFSGESLPGLDPRWNRFAEENASNEVENLGALFEDRPRKVKRGLRFNSGRVLGDVKEKGG